MSVINLLANANKDPALWINKIDVRVKLLFSINIVIVSISSFSIPFLLSYFLLVYLLISSNYGFFHIPRIIWNLKYFIILIFVFYFLISSSIEIQLVVIILKILLLLFSFYMFNRSTNSDELVDALIRLKLPPKIAWVIGGTLRQSIFLIDDVSDVMGIQDTRSRFEKNVNAVDKNWFGRRIAKIKRNVLRAEPLIHSTFSRAIINSIAMGDILFIRGWQGAHKEITLNTASMKKIDFIFLLLVIIVPNLVLLVVWVAV